MPKPADKAAPLPRSTPVNVQGPDRRAANANAQDGDSHFCISSFPTQLSPHILRCHALVIEILSGQARVYSYAGPKTSPNMFVSLLRVQERAFAARGSNPNNDLAAAPRAPPRPVG